MPLTSLDYLDPSSTDDQTEGWQRFLADGAGKECEILPGIYSVTTGTIRSRTVLQMRGATIKAHANLSPGAVLLVNETVSGAPNTYYDTDIQIHGGKFDGDLLPGKTNSLLGFLKCKDLFLERVEICNSTYMGLAIGGSFRPVVSRCDLHHTGKPNITTEGGAAIWLGNTGDGSRCIRADLVDNYIHETQWSGIYASGRIINVHGNQIWNTRESAFFGVVDGLNYLRNHTRGTARKYISASGLELGGGSAIISDSTFEYIGNCAVSLTDVKNSSIHDLLCFEIGTELSYYPQASVVEINSQHPTYSQCNGNNVHDIRLQNSTALFAVLAVVGTGQPVSDLRHGPLNVSGTSFTSGGHVYFQPGTKGSNVVGYL